MFCINCKKTSTQVKNSRGHKKTPEVWRRRYCTNCKTTFTTLEKPSFAANLSVINESGEKTPFFQSRLVISIYQSFAHNQRLGMDSALPLSETVISMLLSTPGDTLSAVNIANTTYDVLDRFDPPAAIQYGLAHGLISTKIRRRQNA